MSTVLVEADKLVIPKGISTLKSFRRWVYSDEFPERGRVCFFNGEVWADMSMEDIFTHGLVKQQYNLTVGGVVDADDLGMYLPDGLLLTNPEVGMSNQPDGLFASHESILEGRVRVIKGKRKGHMELEGSPDMVLEIVSTSSVEKDLVSLRDLYWRAGIREYWIVDARGDRPEFDILRHQPSGYVETIKRGGWVKSEVFGKSFKLTRGLGKSGLTAFHLAVR